MVGCHALLTRLPLSAIRRWVLVRLACVKPAASVRSEPESNSQVESVKTDCVVIHWRYI